MYSILTLSTLTVSTVFFYDNIHRGSLFKSHDMYACLNDTTIRYIRYGLKTLREAFVSSLKSLNT